MQLNICKTVAEPLGHIMLSVVSRGGAGSLLGCVPLTDGAPFLALRVGGCCVEDVKHFLLECPAYQHLRARYPCVFGDAMPDGTTQSEQLQLLAIFDCDSQQDQLAHVVYTMTVFREHSACRCRTRQPYSDHQCPANCAEEDVELPLGSNRLSRS
jgi:hypothetical protein